MSENFDALSNFILNEMRMSHIYQPVMLIELLERGVPYKRNEIAAIARPKGSPRGGDCPQVTQELNLAFSSL